MPSRVWLVFRDYHGVDLDPIRVCRTFAVCKQLVKSEDSLGPSVFIGLQVQSFALQNAFGHVLIERFGWHLDMQ